MKFGVAHIIRGHFKTLRNSDSNNVALPDLFCFFAFPCLPGIAAVYSCIGLGNDFYSLIVSIFSIFTALLLSVQIALFGIYQRNWSVPQDKRAANQRSLKIEERRVLLYELNMNISYLTVISCFSVVVVLVFYIFELKKEFETFFFLYLFSHFFLTLLMVIKRAHAVFEKEYDTPDR